LLLSSADRDLFQLVSAVQCGSERYRGRVHYVQAEAARMVGEYDHCLALTKEMIASLSSTEVFDGLMVEGLVHRDQGHNDESYTTLVKARDHLSEENSIRLECEIAETLIVLERFVEARQVLERLIAKGVEDGDQLERVFFQLGTVALSTSNGAEAIRFFSKSRGAAKEKENGELYLCLADAYCLVGMQDKAAEYALRAKKVRPPV
jgi:tetratricopeptide (TPR) repeat protein